MAKKAVTFVTGWSRYNPGETAAFDQAQADDLIKQKKAVLAADQPVAAGQVDAEAVDFRDTAAFKEASAEIERAATERAATELAERSNELDRREAWLAEREDAIVKRERAAETDVSEGEVSADKPADDKANPAAKPSGLPKQGR